MAGKIIKIMLKCTGSFTILLFLLCILYISISNANIYENNHRIVFIDNSLHDYDFLMAGLLPGYEAFLINCKDDGIRQIAEVLKDKTDITEIHIISHGTSASLNIGKTALSLENLDHYSAELAIIKKSLINYGDIFLYGCELASGIKGRTFINRISELTGADVAASVNKTGAISLGGDWELEYKSGSVIFTNPVCNSVLKSFSILLDVMTFDSGPSYTGFTFSGFTGTGLIYLSNAVVPGTITKNSGAFDLVSIYINPYSGSDTWTLSSNLGHSLTDQLSSPARTLTLNWNGITQLTITRQFGTGCTEWDNLTFSHSVQPVPNCLVMVS